tara:strand:+ start:144 stop:911 length:768 start_codon:yes stop_codon:yes gene_type:complete
MKIGSNIMIVFISLLFSVPQSVSDLYESGLLSYNNSNYKMTINNFESIIDNGWYSSELLYNLGNSYYRLENFENAVWAYEQCLIIDPNNKDAIFNLDIVRLKLADSFNYPDSPPYVKIYFSIVNLFSYSNWIKILLLSILSFFILNAISRIVGLYEFQKYKLLFIYPLMFLVIISFHSVYINYSFNKGIILNDLIVMSEPNDYSTELFNIHKGLKVEIIKISNDWLEIALPDGKSGWIKNNNIRSLSLNKRLARF